VASYFFYDVSNIIMIKYSIGLMLIVMLTECSREQTNNNIVSTDMDTTKVGTKIITHVEGEQGAIFVDDGGTGGVPVIFAHSFAGSTLYSREQLDHLRGDRRVVAFDFRNHGNSDSADVDAFSAEELANDIQVVIDSLHLSHVILVGHSMGGTAAIAYAARHPEKISGLVLAGTPGRTPLEEAKQVIASLKSEKYQTVMDQYMKRLLINAIPLTDSLLTRDIGKIDKERSISIIQSMFEYDPTPDLAKYDGPKLIISTSAEEQQPNSLHKLAPEIPHKVIDGTSHWTMIDKAKEFNAILDEFISQIR
jgi:pimeloyl-ACP methyl ester carboxylesterase